MKKITLFVFTLTLFTTAFVNAQTRALKKVMELKMPKTSEDDMPGTRGASVAWNPLTKKYYASFAGNMGYPMGVFDATGKRISADDLTTMIDTRGLWYNPVTKTISGNGYSDFGWFSYVLDAKGIPAEIKTDFDGQYQPNEQSVGVFDPATKMLLFLYGSQVHFYKIATADSSKAIQLHVGRRLSDGAAVDEDPSYLPEDYNYTSIVFTGIKGAQIGVLNTTEKQIELYNMANGYRQQVLTLPSDASLQSSFNFAYANGIYWLFDIPNRKWVGYK